MIDEYNFVNHSKKIYFTTFKNVISDEVVSESLMMLLTVPKTDF